MGIRKNLKYSILFQLGNVYAISRQLFPVGIKICVTLSSCSSRCSFSSLVVSFLLSCSNALKVLNLLQLKLVFADLTEMQIGKLKCLSWFRLIFIYWAPAMCPALCKLLSHILFLLSVYEFTRSGCRLCGRKREKRHLWLKAVIADSFCDISLFANTLLFSLPHLFRSEKSSLSHITL